MKVLQVIHTLSVGGAEKVLITLANLQRRNGDDVSVLTLLEAGELKTDLDTDIPFWSLHRKWKFNPLTMYRFVRIARRFDIVHVHSAHNLRYVFFSKLLFGLRTCIIFHEHSGNIEVNTSVKWHQALIYPKIYFIGVSEKLCQWARSNVGVPRNQVFLLRNIVSNHPYLPNGKKKESPGLKIVTVGNIKKLKNIEFAIKLLAKFTDDLPSSLTIIGRISDEKYYEDLLVLVKSLGLEEKVCFEHKINDIQPILCQFDMAVHPAHYESGPLVLIEYMAQGIPFLAHEVGEISRLVKDQYPEYFTKDFDLDLWKEQILKIVASTPLEKKKQMRRLYESHFSETKYYQHCREIYRKALHY